ncbi:lasso RiPP family leader peptide-containing protein [Egibacter rhizosphaerae]|nr:lasso RiPP family leader peptide-containing protein [Egibacter rhizosphaerae]
MSNQAYAAPTITEWGTVVDVTAGMGNTSSSDDFMCSAGDNDFHGSTGQCPPGQG